VFQRPKEDQAIDSEHVCGSDRYVWEWSDMRAWMSAATRLTTLLSVHDSIAIFNCFVWDFCSFLWKGPPLPSLDPSAESKARANSICCTDLSPRNVGEIAQGRVSCSLGLIHCTWSCVCSICFGLYENAQTRPQHFVANSRSSTWNIQRNEHWMVSTRFSLRLWDHWPIVRHEKEVIITKQYRKL
jgi:hypothetical protein